MNFSCLGSCSGWFSVVSVMLSPVTSHVTDKRSGNEGNEMLKTRAASPAGFKKPDEFSMIAAF